VKRRLLEIDEQEAKKVAAQKAKNITVADASSRWLWAQKLKSKETAAIYNTAANRIDPEVTRLQRRTLSMQH
jgi:hypothetical protein